MSFEPIIKRIAKTFSRKYHEHFVEEKKSPGMYLISRDDMQAMRDYIMISPMVHTGMTMKFFNEIIVLETLHRYAQFKDEDEILAMVTGMTTAANSMICYAAMEVTAILIESKYVSEEAFRTPEDQYNTELEQLKRAMNGEKEAIDELINGLDLDEEPFNNLDFHVEWPPENFTDLY